MKKVTADAHTQLTDNKHTLAYGMKFLLLILSYVFYDCVNVYLCVRLSIYTVAGLGFGLMSGAFAIVNVLADSVGPGTVGYRGGSPIFFVTSALTTLCFIFLHTAWGVTFFHALDNKNWVLLSSVVVSHLAASLLVSSYVTAMLLYLNGNF